MYRPYIAYERPYIAHDVTPGVYILSNAPAKVGELIQAVGEGIQVMSSCRTLTIIFFYSLENPSISYYKSISFLLPKFKRVQYHMFASKIKKCALHLLAKIKSVQRF